MAEAPTIDVKLVHKLISEQFPEWSHLAIQPVEKSGWDNRTFHLGDNLLVRLPSAVHYAPQPEKEQRWLPIIALQLNVAIPKPVKMGRPSNAYPWHWSVYEWIVGTTAEATAMEDQEGLAVQLGEFLLNLQKVETKGAPGPGKHNFYRGGCLRHYDSETRQAVDKIRNHINSDLAIKIWQRAIANKWESDPVWVHGDFSPGNILIKNGQLAAVIDFGCSAVGDPACDLVIAWTFLNEAGRQAFRSTLGFDDEIWHRARGWALWKALITVAANPESTDSEYQLGLIEMLLTSD